jgi:hypothetical protein
LTITYLSRVILGQARDHGPLKIPEGVEQAKRCYFDMALSFMFLPEQMPVAALVTNTLNNRRNCRHDHMFGG